MSLGLSVSSGLVGLQLASRSIAVLGTVGLLGLFLSVTAYLAARNVLGDVARFKALGVGIGPAVVAYVTGQSPIPGGIGVVVALLIDGVAIHYLYGESTRTTAYITAIHVIVTIILGAVLFGVTILFSTLPG